MLLSFELLKEIFEITSFLKQAKLFWFINIFVKGILFFLLKHQEQIRDENNKMSASTVPAKTTSTSSNQANVASTLTAPTTSSTMTSATENVKTSSTGTTELSAPRSQFTGPTDNANAGPTTGGGNETSGTCDYWILVI